MKKVWTAAFAVFSLLLIPATAQAFSNVATFNGQGFIADGFGGYDLRTEICNQDGPYLLWVLTATGSNNADITGPWGTATMTKFGNGTFKYQSDWYDPDTLTGNVSSSYDGKVKNAQLVVSHGCRPFDVGAWCSPGFWKNASAAAWALTGYGKSSEFNATVYSDFFGNALTTGTTLGMVLAAPNTYSGPPVSGDLGYSLNAYNATGAFLTQQLAGFEFDPVVMAAGGSNACPIDSNGTFK